MLKYTSAMAVEEIQTNDSAVPSPHHDPPKSKTASSYHKVTFPQILADNIYLHFIYILHAPAPLLAHCTSHYVCRCVCACRPVCMSVCVTVRVFLRRHAVTFRSPGGQGHMSALCRRAGVESPSGPFIHSARWGVCVCFCV